MRHARRISIVPAESQAVKGRGTTWALEHRFSSQHAEPWDDGWGTLDQQATEEVLAPQTQIIEERVKSILKFLFPVPKPDSTRVITFANRNDYISFRHHSFQLQPPELLRALLQQVKAVQALAVRLLGGQAGDAGAVQHGL